MAVQVGRPIAVYFQEPSAVAGVAPVPITGLMPCAGTLPQLVGALANRHLAICRAANIDFSKIEAYATGKVGTGFLGLRFWSNKSRAKKYLTQQLGEANLKAVLAKMPRNASRSLSVLCLLIKNGLPPASVSAIFQNDKASLERGHFEVKNLPENIDISAVKQLAQCRTSTFLKELTNAVVAVRMGALVSQVVDCAPEQQRAAAEQILALARDSSLVWASRDTEIQAKILIIIALLRVVKNAPEEAQRQAADAHILALIQDPFVQARLLNMLRRAVENAPEEEQQTAVEQILTLAREPAIRGSRNACVQARLLDALSGVVAFALEEEQQQVAAEQILTLAREPAIRGSSDPFLQVNLLYALRGVVAFAPEEEQQQAATEQILALSRDGSPISTSQDANVNRSLVYVLSWVMQK